MRGWVVPINGFVYANKKCDSFAIAKPGVTAWRKNQGSPQLEEVICTRIPGHDEVMWVDLKSYRRIWKPMWRLVRVSWRHFAELTH